MVTTKENFADTLPTPREKLDRLTQRILNKVLEEPIPRGDLCRQFRMKWTTMYDHLNKLEKLNYIKRIPLKDGNRGCPKKYWMGKDYNEKEFQKNSIDAKITEVLKDRKCHTILDIVERTKIPKGMAWLYIRNMVKDGLVKKIYNQTRKQYSWKIVSKKRRRTAHL